MGPKAFSFRSIFIGPNLAEQFLGKQSFPSATHQNATTARTHISLHTHLTRVKCVCKLLRADLTNVANVKQTQRRALPQVG
jgi:hypothetical protein